MHLPHHMTFYNYRFLQPLTRHCVFWNDSKLYQLTVLFFLLLFCCAAGRRRPWHPHSWEFLNHTQRRTTVWKSYQKSPRPLPDNYPTLTTDKSLCYRVGFEPAISAVQRPQNYAIERAVTGTGINPQLRVKQCHYRPGHTFRVPGSRGSQISRQSAIEGGNVVSPTHRPPLSAGNIPGTHLLEGVSNPGP